MTALPQYTLNDGNPLPAMGLGTAGMHDEEAVAAVDSAIASGYRLLDTALNYENEREIGEGIRRSGIDRDALIVTTKIPGRHHGYDKTLVSCTESLDALGLARIDLYLIHWPNPQVGRFIDTWRAMIDLRERGLVRSIGVSNFTAAMITRLIDETGVTPAVNQVELHPYFPQAALRAFHAEHGIRTESWSPIAKRQGLREEPMIVHVAQAHGVTPSQVVLRWHVELGAVPIPKSVNAARQRENADIFGFSLSAEEVAAISALERGRLWGGDPETHEEF